FSRDWSSDVCSSDLAAEAVRGSFREGGHVRVGGVRVMVDVDPEVVVLDVRLGSGEVLESVVEEGVDDLTRVEVEVAAGVVATVAIGRASCRARAPV